MDGKFGDCGWIVTSHAGTVVDQLQKFELLHDSVNEHCRFPTYTEDQIIADLTPAQIHKPLKIA